MRHTLEHDTLFDVARAMAGFLWTRGKLFRGLDAHSRQRAAVLSNVIQAQDHAPYARLHEMQAHPCIHDKQHPISRSCAEFPASTVVMRRSSSRGMMASTP